MMKNGKKGTSILIGLVIVIVGFVRGDAMYLCLGVLGVAWLAVLLLRHIGNIRIFFKKRLAQWKQKRKVSATSVKQIDAEPTQVEKASKLEQPKVLPERALIRHINYRITDKLRSVYADAVWDWDEKPTVQFITEGGCHRIKVSDAGDYNYAEVHVDRFSDIKINLMKVTACQVQAQDPVVADFPVDVESWYDNRAQSILESIIGELNGRGIHSLNINEAGEIQSKEGEKVVLQGKLENMPAKNSWKALADLLETKFELKATVDNEQACVSW